MVAELLVLPGKLAAQNRRGGVWTTFAKNYNDTFEFVKVIYVQNTVGLFFRTWCGLFINTVRGTMLLTVTPTEPDLSRNKGSCLIIERK